MREKIIQLLKYVVVAIIQGIAEILPISSSGHMVIVKDLLGLTSSDLTFEVFLHFASLFALLIFFRKRLIELCTHFFIYLFKKSKIDKEIENTVRSDFFLCIYLIVATIPAGLVGILLSDMIEKSLSNMLYVGILLIINAGMLFTVNFFKKTKEMRDLTWKNALIIGLFQCLGIFPGISRSGSCIVGTSTQKMKKSEAAEFAFLMGIPMFLGTTILKTGDIFTCLKQSELIIPYLVSFLIAGMGTYISLHLFLKFVKKQKLTYFSIYCVFVGFLSIILYFVL